MQLNNSSNVMPKAQRDTSLSERRRDFFLSKKAETEACQAQFCPKQSEVLQRIDQRNQGRKNLSATNLSKSNRKERTVLRLRKTPFKRKVNHVLRTTSSQRHLSVTAMLFEEGEEKESSFYDDMDIDLYDSSFYSSSSTKYDAKLGYNREERPRLARRGSVVLTPRSQARPHHSSHRRSSMAAATTSFNNKSPRRSSIVTMTINHTEMHALPTLSSKFSLNW